MTDETINAIVKLANLAKPVEVPTSHDWGQVEETLGIMLPKDLKLLVSALGGGHFGDGMYVLNPASSSTNVRFARQNILDFLKETGPAFHAAGVPLYPELCGYLYVGGSYGCMQMVIGPDSSYASPYKMIWMDMERSLAHRFESTICEFIHDLYLGRLREQWTTELRDFIWQPGLPFFKSRPGRIFP